MRQWILAHERDEPAHLMLQAHRFTDIPVREAVVQIQARQKAKHKLPSWYATEAVVYPPLISVEQSSSQETASYKADLLEGKTMADLTGGMGVDTFFLARHFQEAFYVEQAENLCQLARHNFQLLGAPHIKVVHATAEEFLRNAPRLDFIYLDPARRGQGNQKLYKLADCQPNVTSLLPLLFEKTDTILLKAAPMLDIRQGLKELEGVKEVHVVAVKNEVKELLFLIKKGTTGEPLIKAANLKADHQEIFEFTFSEEQQAEAPLSEPLQYLYEPHAALLKAGAFKLLAQKYGLFKLHPNSHLYTAASLKEDFPGRAFQILYAGKADKKVLRKYLPEAKALISSRNHPLSVQQITKKYSLQEGGGRYLFATTFSAGKAGVLVCEKVHHH